MQSRPVANPPVRFRDVLVTYDEGDGPPPAKVTLLDDASRTILSHNDSPDLPFRWSVNPYRGCLHACSYCLHGDTRILMADGRHKRLAELQVGDEIYGTRAGESYRHYTRTRVLAHWTTLKLAYCVRLADGTELIASGDHRFLTDRGWKYVAPVDRPAQGPFLTPQNRLIGTGAFAPAATESAEYRRGYLCGMVGGDATDRQHHFRLALIDLEALARTTRYLSELDVKTHGFQFAETRTEWPSAPSEDWDKGFLAGIFDAEGSRSDHILRISNKDRRMIDETVRAMLRFSFDVTLEVNQRDTGPIFNVRMRGGLREHLRFFHFISPAISRKWDLEGRALENPASLRIVSIEPLGLRQLYDITTGTGDFIANGVVSHNCYARPTHEYLDLGAGTDFDTKIVVKREAPALLREAFDKPSWNGELVMFSGVTDCYQAIEKELELTRRCLEVCAEYRNPVGVISKSALVERDLDLFQTLARDAQFHIFVSLAFTDNEQSRAIEPWAASPDRRFKVIETLAKAGLPVGVMIAPVIPGVNDRQMVGVLERAAAAGATAAGWVLLRLPGAVKAVFEERLRAAMPLAADKVLSRIRDTRGGERLYDPRFHARGRGQGPYAETLAMMFDTTIARLGMYRRDEDAAPTTFRRPPPRTAQLSLF